MLEQKRVLVVDDSLLICRQVERVFQGEGEILIRQAHTGEAALKEIEKTKPDLILLDVVLPDMEGYDLFSKIGDMGIPVIFLTSKDRDEDVVKGFAMGACDYIKKPFQPGELKSRVFVHLEERRKQKELEHLNQMIRANMEKLNSMVYRDELTGLYNRRYVMERVLEPLAAREFHGILVMIDIDDFKTVNDSYGHEAGDTALICIASMMEESFHGHTVVRWGGEEFLIILADEEERAAGKLCEKFRRDVEEFPFSYGDCTFFCTVTLGLAVYCRKKALKENLACADKALYTGKKRGKNQVVCYGEDEKTEKT